MAETITLEADSTELIQILDEIKSLLKLKIDLEGFRETLFEFLDLLKMPSNFFSVDLDRTEGTLAFYILKPTQQLIDFLAALRALDRPCIAG